MVHENDLQNNRGCDKRRGGYSTKNTWWVVGRKSCHRGTRHATAVDGIASERPGVATTSRRPSSLSSHPGIVAMARVAAIGLYCQSTVYCRFFYSSTSSSHRFPFPLLSVVATPCIHCSAITARTKVQLLCLSAATTVTVLSLPGPEFSG